MSLRSVNIVFLGSHGPHTGCLLCLQHFSVQGCTVRINRTLFYFYFFDLLEIIKRFPTNYGKKFWKEMWFLSNMHWLVDFFFFFFFYNWKCDYMQFCMRKGVSLLFRARLAWPKLWRWHICNVFFEKTWLFLQHVRPCPRLVSFSGLVSNCPRSIIIVTVTSKGGGQPCLCCPLLRCSLWICAPLPPQPSFCCALLKRCCILGLSNNAALHRCPLPYNHVCSDSRSLFLSISVFFKEPFSCVVCPLLMSSQTEVWD